MLGFASCAGQCQGKLSCALGDSGVSFSDGGISFGDATIGTNKTCKDLLACCNSLSDADEKDQCKMTHTQISASGDFACGVVIQGFCP